MIRIKCPKCAVVQQLDDDEAGQVALCADCGAKFRVPAKKTAAAAKPGKKEEEKRAVARRQQDDEDEDEDDQEDEDEDEPAKKTGKSKKDQSSISAASMVVAVAYVAALVILALGSIYINVLGMLVAGACLLMTMTCSLMVAREALNESGMKFALVLVVPYMFFFENWERTKRIFFAHTAFLLMTLAGAGGFYLHEGKVEAKRQETKKKLKSMESGALMMRVDRDAGYA